MTQDFAKKPKASGAKKNGAKQSNKPRPKSQVPGWVWLFTGVVTGVFLCFLAYLADIAPAPKPADQRAVASKQDKVEEPEENNTTRFDFYTLLPEREVIVPEEQSRPESKPQESYIYILQAGSFKSAADADRLRAKLILMGLDTKVEAVSGKGSGTWHRVQVGPFSSRSKLSAARSALINEGVETLLLKRKAET